MTHLELTKHIAIKKAIEAMGKAITFKSSVGACIYTDYDYYIGFNFENKIHKGYHAEEIAIINSKLNNVQNNQYKGIVIVYHFPDHLEIDGEDKVYPACASCRQFLWEYTNPNILITVVDINGNIKYENTLEKLYPFPYPR